MAVVWGDWGGVTQGCEIAGGNFCWDVDGGIVIIGISNTEEEKGGQGREGPIMYAAGAAAVDCDVSCDDGL